MTTSSESAASQPAVDRDAAEAVIDRDAAEVDARSPDVAAQIAELEAEADDLGLPTPSPAQVDIPAQD